MYNYVITTSHQVSTEHHNLQSISQLKQISKGTCSIHIVNGLYHKIHEFSLKLLPLT